MRMSGRLVERSLPVLCPYCRTVLQDLLRRVAECGIPGDLDFATIDFDQAARQAQAQTSVEPLRKFVDAVWNAGWNFHREGRDPADVPVAVGEAPKISIKVLAVEAAAARAQLHLFERSVTSKPIDLAKAQTQGLCDLGSSYMLWKRGFAHGRENPRVAGHRQERVLETRSRHLAQFWFR